MLQIGNIIDSDAPPDILLVSTDYYLLGIFTPEDDLETAQARSHVDELRQLHIPGQVLRHNALLRNIQLFGVSSTLNVPIIHLTGGPVPN